MADSEAELLDKSEMETETSDAPLEISNLSKLDSNTSDLFDDDDEEPIKAPPKPHSGKSALIKPFNLHNLKNPAYDSSNLLNQAFDPNHKLENYGHGSHSKAILSKKQMQNPGVQAMRKQINHRTNPKFVITSPKVSEKANAKVVDDKKEEEEEVEAKAEPLVPPTQKLKVNKKSPTIKPFDMRKMKSPTYDSSNALNMAFTDKPRGRVPLRKQSNPREQMMMKKIAMAGGPSKFVLSPASAPSKDEKQKKEKEEEIEAKEPEPPKVDKLHVVMKKPFNLRTLKSPTYDSSTLLNQAFNPSYKFEDYAHEQPEKVSVKTGLGLQMQGAERIPLKKQVTTRSAASPSAGSDVSIDFEDPLSSPSIDST